MKISFWQFLAILAAVAVIWYLVYYWGESQDGQSWIKSMNDFFFSSDKSVDSAIEGSQSSGAEGWSK